MTFSPKVWGDALRQLQQDIPDFVFDAWIAPLEAKLAGDRLVLGCTTSFHRDRIRNNHLPAIKQALAAAGATNTDLELLTANEFAGAAGHTLDVSASLQDSCRGSAQSQQPQQSQQHGQHAERAGMRSVGVVSRAQVVNGSDSHAGMHSPISRGGSSMGTSGAGSTDQPSAFRAPLQSVPSPSVAPMNFPSAAPAFAPAAAPASSRASSSAATATENSSATPATDSDAGFDSPGTLAGVPAFKPLNKSAARVRNDASTSSHAGPNVVSRAGVPQMPRTARPTGPRSEMQGGSSFGLDGEPGSRNAELFSFERFIVGPCNSLAREAALALARKRQQSLNLLYLAGLSGMGKTHLARAAADEARRALPESRATGYASGPGAAAPRAPRSRVLYTTAETFTSEFVSAMRNGRNDAWTARYRGPIELLIVEDVQFLSGRTKTQQELFHTINHVLESGGRVLLTGDRTPRDLTGLDEKLRAIVGRGFIAELDRPDAIVRRHILREKAAAGGVNLPADCLDLLVDASECEALGASVTDLESLLIQVVTTSSLLGRAIEKSLVQEAIDLKAGAGAQLAPRQIAVPEVVKAVAAFFGARPEALASRSRRRDVLLPRQLAMYLSHRYTDASLTEIGRALGRDHPSVRNAIKKVEAQVLKNAPLRYQVEALSEKIDGMLKG